MNSLVRNLPDNTIPIRNTDLPPPSTYNSRRISQHQPSISISQSKSRRSLASLARERTSNAFATLTSIGTNSTPSLRNATSSGSLAQRASNQASGSRPGLPRSPTSPSELPQSNLSSRRASGVPLAALEKNRQSGVPQMSTARGNPNERGEKGHGRMHQTASKVLRMTDDDRPFTRDFKDLFATLITSLPLTPHRVRFTRVDETFLSEEAITNLASLRFSQSNRLNDPENPARWVITTTTTTF